MTKTFVCVVYAEADPREQEPTDKGEKTGKNMQRDGQSYYKRGLFSAVSSELQLGFFLQIVQKRRRRDIYLVSSMTHW